MSKKLLFIDVDGTLTDGKIYIGANGEVMKAFSVKDGYGIESIIAKSLAIPVILTGRESKIVGNRCLDLGIANFYQGVKDKILVIKKFEQHYPGSPLAYMEDDSNDIEAMEYIKMRNWGNGLPVRCPRIRT